jgi:hypothetical protein
VDARDTGGLLGGDGPAVRVWYGDSTLRAMLYSAYTHRASRDTAGRDNFFRFGTVAVLVEVHPGTEPVTVEESRDPAWRHDHEVLASLFVHAGDIEATVRQRALDLVRAIAVPRGSRPTPRPSASP